MRESFIFYKSFYDSIKELDQKDQVQIYNAIFEYQFNGKMIDLSNVCKSIFTLIIPQLKANNKRYENGKKGGRPKTKLKPKDNQNKTKLKPNVNVNDNVNVNVNVNDNITTTNIDIFSYIEEHFGITIGGKNYEDIYSWLLSFTPDILKYAVDISVASGNRTIRYWNGILNNWKGCNYKTLQDIIDNEEKTTKIKTQPKSGNDKFNDTLDNWARKRTEDKNDN